MNVGNIDITFVFRHKWDKESKRNFGSDFRPYRLGLFFNKTMCIKNSTPESGSTIERFSRLAPSIIIGVNFLICKMWITIDNDVMKFSDDL